MLTKVLFPWPGVIAHLVMLGLWVWMTGVAGVPRFIVPGPIETFATLVVPHYRWATHVAVTSGQVVVGFGLAVLVGVALAVLFTWFLPVRRTLMPLLVTLNLVPKVALAPLLIVWFGYGLVANVLITFVIAFFPIVITVARGLSEVEPDLLDLVRVHGATRWQVFRKIQLPGALPYLFSGMRVAAVLAIAGTIVGEFIGSEAGLGFLMLSAQATLDTPAMFMALILITAIGITLYATVIGLEALTVTLDARLR